MPVHGDGYRTTTGSAVAGCLLTFGIILLICLIFLAAIIAAIWGGIERAIS